MLLYGIGGVELKWFESYLSIRQQCVFLQGTKSNFLTVKIRNSTRFNTKAINFCLYVNDICNLQLHSKTKISLYFSGFLGKRHGLDVGQNTTLSDRHPNQKLVEFFIITHSELKVAWDDPRFLVVADDKAVFHHGKDYKVCECNLQKVFSSILKWLQYNGMFLNANETKQYILVLKEKFKIIIFVFITVIMYSTQSEL